MTGIDKQKNLHCVKQRRFFYLFICMCHLIRKIHMDGFDTVLIQRFDYEPDIILRHEGITCLREAVKAFDDKAAQRIIILGFQRQIEPVIQIVQIHRTFNYIFIFRNFMNKILFILIIFVMDLPDDLFQQVFQSNKSGCFAIFI